MFVFIIATVIWPKVKPKFCPKILHLHQLKVPKCLNFVYNCTSILSAHHKIKKKLRIGVKVLFLGCIKITVDESIDINNDTLPRLALGLADRDSRNRLSLTQRERATNKALPMAHENHRLPFSVPSDKPSSASSYKRKNKKKITFFY